MKKILALIVALSYFLQASASHISGGELFYEYIGPGALPNSSKYKITMRLFRDCHPADPNAQLLESEVVVVGIYNNRDLSFEQSVQLTLIQPIPVIQLNTSSIPCLTNAPEVCFQVGLFSAEVELPASPDGHLLSWIRCCRRTNIANLSVETGVGATFTTTIPGTNILPAGHNSSPQFAIKDTALVCQNKNFTLDFGATDPDGDAITYSFCDAYLGGTVSNPDPGAPAEGGLPPNLPLNPLPYKSPYSGSSPLSSAVTINPLTGKITGIAPAAGSYVINVCATERRNGKVINVHHKDFILEVGNCDFAAAEPLPVSGAWCKDFTVHFSNNNSSSVIQSYHWDFGVQGATSDEATPDYTYADTGVYTIKLTVNGSGGCVDQDSTTLGVYPGFKPDFDVTGGCFKLPVVFKDKSFAANGIINSWSWNFGDSLNTSDSSSEQNPTYKYSDTGTRNVRLAVTSTKGCIDSITKPVEVKSAAALSLPFRDTLICRIDTLSLKAIATGSFTWTPAYNIINANTSNPYVFPKQKTTYVVTVADPGGCVNQDSITVNVLDSVTVDAGADTTICGSDAIILNAVGTGLQYQWQPVTGLSGSDIRNPTASPDTTTTYSVTANLGKCEATDAVTVEVKPYPRADAGSDVTICYGNDANLSASITGTSFTWYPVSSLVNSNTLTPVARPSSTTSYILNVYDSLGCPKPGSDTVVVSVMPPVKAFAGNDTDVIANQPLQLSGSGGSVYMWTPSTGMNDASIANPIVTLSAAYDSVIYKVRVSDGGGCFGEDEVKVRVFKTGPDIFIPTAFTPNADGRNDVLKPLPVGIKNFHYFRIYNRWGEMLYSTSTTGNGWDGTFEGKAQPTGTYVFMAEATDYLGKLIFKKGTFVLIR